MLEVMKMIVRILILVFVALMPFHSHYAQVYNITTGGTINTCAGSFVDPGSFTEIMATMIFTRSRFAHLFHRRCRLYLISQFGMLRPEQITLKCI